jgi:signal transduction histidine kinase
VSERGLPSVVAQILIWAAGNSLAGAAIGLAVGFIGGSEIERPTIVISVLFANVVGFTATIASIVLFPRLRGLAPPLRVLLLGLALLSGAVVGSVAVLNFYPLFVFRDLRQAAAIVAINGLLALIVGGVVVAYEGMRLRLQDSLREVREVRLAEARLREEAARAELSALQARINPHFFFNTLNTITYLVAQDPEQAEEVIQKLAELFRYTFKVSGAGPVALQEELDFTRDYLAVEQARFGERLLVEWDLDPESLLLPVPGLILQPLVENAVGHGLAPRAEGGRIRIRSRLVDRVLHLDVADDGVGLPDGGRVIHEGHGLGNVQRRLHSFYQGRASLGVQPNPEGRGTLARMLLPLLRGAVEPRPPAPEAE